VALRHLEDPAAAKAFKDNQWNKYRVECRGNSIKTWINGVPCTKLTDNTDRSGLIGLQVHGIKKGTGPYEVRWRNIRIQEFPAAEKKVGGALVRAAAAVELTLPLVCLADVAISSLPGLFSPPVPCRPTWCATAASRTLTATAGRLPGAHRATLAT